MGWGCLTCPLHVTVSSFHDDAPKDYRQVSLTAVKQRFEDKRYGEISQEKVPLSCHLGIS